MKMRSIMLAAIVSILFLSCQPADEGYEIGLYVINESAATADFCVTSPTPYKATRNYETVEAGDEWHFESIYYGTFAVSIVDANQKDIQEVTTYVYKGTDEKATLVKWNGSTFTEEVVDAE